jgi:hypothetical protein
MHADGSVCRGPDVQEPKTVQTNPRDDCERGLRISIARVKNIDGQPLSYNAITKPGPVKLLIEGDGIANATSAEMGGGIGVTVGAAAQRVGSSPQGTCLPPNCQVAQFDAFPNAPTGRQTLRLFTPHRYASASVDLDVVAAPVPVTPGDVQCTNPASQPHVRMVLAQNRVNAGQNVPGNQLIFSFSSSSFGQAPLQWTLTLHQSFLGGVSPANVVSNKTNLMGPVPFSFSAPPAQPVPQAPSGQGGRIVHPVGLGPVYRCVWARLDWNGGTEEVAVPVAVIP